MTRLLVNVDVDDLQKALRFYTSALELRVGRRFGDDYAELLGTDAPIYLLLARAGSAAFPARGAVPAAARAYARHWTPVHLDFAVQGIDAAVERAVAAGAVLEKPIAQREWGKLAVLADPFGHGFCLLEFEGRGYDAIATTPVSDGAAQEATRAAGPPATRGEDSGA